MPLPDAVKAHGDLPAANVIYLADNTLCTLENSINGVLKYDRGKGNSKRKLGSYLIEPLVSVDGDIFTRVFIQQ